LIFCCASAGVETASAAAMAPASRARLIISSSSGNIVQSNLRLMQSRVGAWNPQGVGAPKLPRSGAFSYCSRRFLPMKRSILDYIAEHASRNPGRVAIHFKDRKISYRELEDAAARCLGALFA